LASSALSRASASEAAGEFVESSEGAAAGSDPRALPAASERAEIAKIEALRVDESER